MEIDQKTREIIVAFLKGVKTKKISKAKMEELKDEILKKTDIRMLNLSTLKKMVKKIAKETAQAEKIEEAKIESISGFKPVIIPITTQAFQNMILYDLSASKKTLERLNERLESIKEAGKTTEFKTKISSEISLIRKEIEKLANKLEYVEKQLIQKTKK
ncbi:MAG: hypothetical protein QXO35_01840 [Candidatus Micrarchaeia archaeon]